MENNDKFNDLIDFQELDAFNVPKASKRRSSILKSFDANVVETNREERKSIRRVSWAQTYQCKELHADGTTVIISQVMAKTTDENNGVNDLKLLKCDDECTVEVEANTSLLNKSLIRRKQKQQQKQMKINARDFVKKLRSNGNTSMLSIDQNSLIESPNRKSKIANESMIQSNGENNDLIQLRESVDMELTSLNSSTSIDQNVCISDCMSVKMSIDEQTIDDNVSVTKVFTDSDMEMTFNSSQESELIKFSGSEAENDKNCSNRKHLNRMLNTTMISHDNLLDLSNTNSFINLTNDRNLIQDSVHDINEIKTEIIRKPKVDSQLNCDSHDINNSYVKTNTEARNDNKNNKRAIECEYDSPPREKKLKIENCFENKEKPKEMIESTETSSVCLNNENSMIGSVDMELTPVVDSFSSDSKQIHSNDCLPSKMSIDEQTNENISSTKVFTDNDMEMTCDSTQESELIKFNTTEEILSDKNHSQYIHNTTMISNINLIDSNSLIDSSIHYHTILNDDISKNDNTNPINAANNEISVEEFRRSDKESFGVTHLQCDNEFYLSRNSVANMTRQSFLTDPFTARYEMVKSNIKDSLGLSITHKLKQKKYEVEAKLRQNENLISNSVNMAVSDNNRVNENITENEPEVSQSVLLHKIDDSESILSDPSKETFTTKELSTEPMSEDHSVLSNNESNSTSNDATTNETITGDNQSVYSLFSLTSDSSSNSVEANSPSILMKSITNIIADTSIERLSDSFDPFIHTENSFNANSTFYKSLSPLQLSFMVREDTLCLLADELDRKTKDILIAMEKSLIEYESTLNENLEMSEFSSKNKTMAMNYELRTEQRTVLSFLWGSFILDIKFGEFLESCDSKEIVYINMKSLVDAETPLKLRQENLIFQFREEHKPLLTVAHQLIISSFESKKEHILSKYKTSSQLNELLCDELKHIIYRSKRLLIELRILSSFVICQVLPKDNDTFNFIVELLGVRKTIYLVLPINPELYPFAVIKPKFIIRGEERDIYCLTKFTEALLRIKPDFNYIQRLIKAAKCFIKAMKKLIIDEQKNLRQKREIETRDKVNLKE